MCFVIVGRRANTVLARTVKKYSRVVENLTADLRLICFSQFDRLRLHVFWGNMQFQISLSRLTAANILNSIHPPKLC
ncbi:hypothetical protein EVA_05410 [gut metagenome]|uniref:Uncharacterized protein n=3 Tax=gut metagenome TaxID=749906 RepID=J9GHG1_9ZZZZ